MMGGETTDARKRHEEERCCGRCLTCLDGERPASMIVCPECGNKRCPKATHHANECTGSNKPGQTGSRYA